MDIVKARKAIKNRCNRKGTMARWARNIRSIPIFWRLSLSIVTLVIFLSAALIGGIFWSVDEIVRVNEDREMTKIHRSVVEGIAAESRLAAALATLVAEMPDAKSAFVRVIKISDGFPLHSDHIT